MGNTQDLRARHVAIIMDGNGRWAQRRHLPRVAGHRAGAEAVVARSYASRQAEMAPGSVARYEARVASMAPPEVVAWLHR